jgi:hypothetical protein
MAGAYPNVPDHRMVCDLDGTGLFKISSANAITALLPADQQSLQDESDASFVVMDGVAQKYAVLIFPEKRDLAGYFVSVTVPNTGVSVGLATSVDTTNGVDGTWVNLVAPAAVVAGVAPFGRVTVPFYRSGITAAVAAGIKALRVSVVPTLSADPSSLVAVHLYGTITAGQALDRLAIWDPVLDQPVGSSYFDWGDVPRSSSQSLLFRVKNLSAGMTATTVVCSLDALTDTTPSVPGQHTISSDGGVTFGATAPLFNLSPGEISPLVTLRRVTPVDAVLSLWSLRLSVVATSWV